MRPVHRGSLPLDDRGSAVVFDEYSYARPDLITRIGAYCSFCEMRLPNPAVEHIRHKDNNPGLEREWDNFLLACPSCNSTKGTKIDTAADVERHLWPHQHRSGDAFIYSQGGVVRLAGCVEPELAVRAMATEAMVGLSRLPDAGLTKLQVLKGSDRRYEERRQAWDLAVDARRDLRANDTPELRRQILVLAQMSGFWSVWMTVFADDAAMQSALCEAFAGTARERVYPLPRHMRLVPPLATSAPGVQVRPAHPNDGAGIAAAQVDAIRSLGAAAYGEELIADWGATRTAEQYTQAMARGERLFVAVDADAKIVGFSSHRIEAGNHRTAVYVSGTQVRRGVGTALFLAAELVALAASASALHVDASLVALEFYAANGFTAVASTIHTLESGRPMAAMRMRKSLPSPKSPPETS